MKYNLITKQGTAAEEINLDKLIVFLISLPAKPTTINLSSLS
jgi:hypothetical protein